MLADLSENMFLVLRRLWPTFLLRFHAFDDFKDLEKQALFISLIADVVTWWLKTRLHNYTDPQEDSLTAQSIDRWKRTTNYVKTRRQRQRFDDKFRVVKGFNAFDSRNKRMTIFRIKWVISWLFEN